MILEVKDLKTYFFTDKGVNKAVDGVSFGLKKSQTLCIVGESGSGKSITSLSILGLIEKPGQIVGGSIQFLGQDLLQLKEKQMQKEIRGKKIGMIFQEPMTSLNPSYTVGFQINEVLKIHHPNLNKKERLERVVYELERVGIPHAGDKYHEYPFNLSGGQRQRVMIAMAMVCEPEILIADEPTTALDVTIQAQILELMKELQQKKGTSILFITHDLGVVAQIADEVVVMYKGHVVEQASAKELFADPRHPYTKALLSAIPKPGKEYRKKRLETVDENTDYLSFQKELR
ncbi:ABC transporter ATP-binding protein [Helicobacter pylori]|uniref:Peptide ABC transporter ATP-binding protein n=2 Tax=Helicobacter pylori TaxID=210 RepID=A0AB33Z4R3_HELPX|nr:ABC transporter ATP-binding protein [Helicobacter pylori]AHA87998.1 Dipeptide transport ATP-binding protein DppD [Helicobacter pylori BM012A]AHA89570.1 Dipeptide transport ATP-binding protein DppD [Helicobacter pylori BM012S]AHZ28210.1 peptide ABC transporter ATP-binding protein [Helicobacter pylori]EPZ73195.1 peptide ABC transporter ATP-binding protein [Helicobacter pylori UM084]EQK94091.1 peptide ABC transporter ATP-binding protein [Helicobacter pylori UM037]